MCFKLKAPTDAKLLSRFPSTFERPASFIATGLLTTLHCQEQCFKCLAPCWTTLPLPGAGVDLEHKMVSSSNACFINFLTNPPIRRVRSFILKESLGSLSNCYLTARSACAHCSGTVQIPAHVLDQRCIFHSRSCHRIGLLTCNQIKADSIKCPRTLTEPLLLNAEKLPWCPPSHIFRCWNAPKSCFQ